MVLEPVTTAALVGNIVQLIDFSIKIVGRLDDFREKYDKTPMLFSNIRIRLPLLIDSLTRSRNGIVEGTIAKEGDEALAAVLEGCLAQITKCNEILNKVLPTKGDSWITRSKKAFQSLYHERDMESIRENLQDYIQALTLHHVVSPIGQGAPKIELKSETSTCFQIPNCRVSRFIGREDVLNNIEGQFKAGSAVVIQGMGGQGKTQIALEYCRRARVAHRFSAILWIDASSRSTLETSFESISEIIKSPERVFTDTESRIRFVLTSFATWPGPWLFVFDNYDTPEAFPDIQDFIPSGKCGSILFTTRHADVARYGEVIEIIGMREDEALELLFARCTFEKNEDNVKHGMNDENRLPGLLEVL